MEKFRLLTYIGNLRLSIFLLTFIVVYDSVIKLLGWGSISTFQICANILAIMVWVPLFYFHTKQLNDLKTYLTEE